MQYESTLGIQPDSSLATLLCYSAQRHSDELLHRCSSHRFSFHIASANLTDAILLENCLAHFYMQHALAGPQTTATCVGSDCHEIAVVVYGDYQWGRVGSLPARDTNVDGVAISSSPAGFPDVSLYFVAGGEIRCIKRSSLFQSAVPRLYIPHNMMNRMVTVYSFICTAESVDAISWVAIYSRAFHRIRKRLWQ